MSLFNDMLRDLEARGATVPAAVAAQPALPVRPRPRRWPWLLLILPLVAAVLGLWFWHAAPVAAPVQTTSAAPQPRPPAAPAEPVAAVLSATPAPAPQAPAKSATPVAAAEEVRPEPVTSTPTPAPASTPAAPPPAVAVPAPAASPVATATPIASDFASRLQAVADLLAEGRDREAEAALQALLALEPGHGRARQTLASLYQRQGRTDEAIEVWRQGLAQNPRQTDWAQSLARVLLERGEPAQAATALAAAAPAVAAHPEFHALLGYARQQAGQADLAAATYRELLAVDANSGPWWLGLALAEQTRGDDAAALTAFRRARSGAGLETRVLRYVDARISALEASEP